jgi:hypothetical protein
MGISAGDSHRTDSMCGMTLGSDHGSGLRDRRLWHLHRQDAAAAGDVTHMDLAPVGLYALEADCEPEAEARLIWPTLPVGVEKVGDLARRQTAALILHLDEHTVPGAAGAQCDVPLSLCELECVLNQVGNDGREDFGICVDDDVGRTEINRQSDVAILRLDRRDDLDLRTVKRGARPHLAAHTTDVILFRRDRGCELIQEERQSLDQLRLCRR